MSAWLRLTLVTLTVGGGFLGMAIAAQVMLSPQGIGARVIGVAPIMFYLAVLVSGLMVVQNPRRTRPVMIILVLQLPVIISPIFGYQFSSGLSANFGPTFDPSGMGWFWSMQFGSQFSFGLMPQPPWGFGFNLVPALLLTLLGISNFRNREPSEAMAVDTEAPAA
jgi:hypothetical protein